MNDHIHIIRPPLFLACAIAMFTANAAATTYYEAPALAHDVKAGKLPSVSQRLPEKPEILSTDSIGHYGGVIRAALRGSGDADAVLRMINPQGLVRWKKDFSAVEPNVAESWTLSPDAKEYTFTLRKGMRWSDGEPFDADDILFAMNDLFANSQFFPIPPDRYTADGKLAEVEKIGQYKVKFKFSKPYLTFIEQLATPLGQAAVMYPKHYCEKFHPKYNAKLDDELKTTGLRDWVALMGSKCGSVDAASRWGNPDKPTLDPWVIADPYSASSIHVTLTRNPYFWQVDAAGNQLPYIDSIYFDVISNVDTILLTALSGQLDLQILHISSIRNKSVLAEGAAKGGYKLMSLQDMNATAIAVFINQSTQNEKLRPLFRDKNFRIALSLAMDRKEINDLVFLGQGEPWQIGPARASKFYNEKLAKQYTQYDLKEANALLDKLGLTQRDSDGFRLYPSGGRVAMNVIVNLANSYQIDMLELLRKQYAKAGLDLLVQPAESKLYYKRGNNNDYDLSVDSLPGGYGTELTPRGYLALNTVESRQSLPWVRWRETGGKQGEEPPESMKKRIVLYDEWKDAKTEQEADPLFRQILAIAADDLEVLGTVRPPPQIGIRSTKLMNTYDNMVWGYAYAAPGPSLLQQYYYAK